MAVPNLMSSAGKISGDLVVARARTHRDATTFVKATGVLGALGTAFTGVDDLLTSENAEVRRDWRSDTDPRDPATLLFEEAVLPVGVTASIAGLWSADRGAVVPSSDGLGPQTVSATVGDGRRSRHAPTAPFRSRPLSYVVTATVLTAIGAAIVWVGAHLLRGSVTRWGCPGPRRMLTRARIRCSVLGFSVLGNR